ncbi:MAG: tetratricopeptide repeat protein [Litorilinea sp.]
MIQEFAFGKLAPTLQPTLFSKYSGHYLMTLINTERSNWASRLRLDFENIRSAWQRAVHARSALLIQPAVTPFGDYMAQFGLIPDGERLFQEAAASFDGVDAHRELVAQLLEQQSSLTHSLHGLEAASLLQQQMLTLTNQRELRIKTHSNLAFYYAEIGDWKQADAHFDSINELVDESSDIGLYIHAVESRIRVNALHFRGNFAEGIARLEGMLVLLKATPEKIADVETLHHAVLRTLSSVATRYGDYAAAVRYSHESLALLSELGSPRVREQILGSIALGEEYAGLFTEAIKHHQEAIALALEIGDTENIGTLKTNFCLTLRQSGELEQALIYGLEAIEILSALGHKRIEGQARNRVGHILLAFERWADAYAAYGDALGLWAIVQHPNRYEALAGRAVAALRLDKHAEALALIDEVLDFTAENGLVGIVEPVLLLLNCETVLSEAGEAERANNTLSQASEWVQTIADRISDEDVRAAFLHNRPDNQRLKARLAAFRASPTPHQA